MRHSVSATSKQWAFILSALTASLLPIGGFAQQNFFNVPSSDITHKNKLFFQQQFNIARTGTSNTTLDYGLGNNLEIGLNLFNVNLYSPEAVGNPNFLANFQKAFVITSDYKISFGTQSGITPPVYKSALQLPSFSYVNNAVDLAQWGKYLLGAYYANSAYAGGKDAIGLMAGVEWPLWQNQLHLMGDLLTGTNNISVAVLGFAVHLPGDWQISLGAQLPAPNSHTDYGGVLEITKL